MELESLVSQVKDLLPELGDGFIISCLKYYDSDPEQVVNALLEDNLPPFLSKMDQSSGKLYDDVTSRLSSYKESSKIQSAKVIECQTPSEPKVFSNDVSKKIMLMHPMNLFFTKVKSSSATHKDHRSMYLTDLLHPSLGELESSLQVNFMVEYEWLMMNYEVTKNEHKPLTIIYGEDNNELAINNGRPRKNIIAKRVKPRYPFGTHHTKMMILAYNDNSVRIVVHTANLISSDWENRTQGMWVSPKCPVLRLSDSEVAKSKNVGDSVTKFKECLLRYLNYYEVPALRPFIEKVHACDFSAVNAFFVGSVPGSHVIHRTDAFQNWGHAFIAKILTKYNEDYKETGYDDKNAMIILQSSSIGSLGTSLENSFLMELAASFNASTLRLSKQYPNNVRVVYPSKNNVFNAYGGPLYGGGCLPYSQKTNLKQPWLKNKMCKWESKKIERTMAMPHIKSYTKLSDLCTGKEGDQSITKASFYVLTSANISKAAWGALNKTEDKLWIQSYEAGILLLPKFTHGSTQYSYAVTVEGQTTPSDLVLPYDVPLSEYEANDEPWVMECLTDYL